MGNNNGCFKFVFFFTDHLKNVLLHYLYAVSKYSRKKSKFQQNLMISKKQKTVKFQHSEIKTTGCLCFEKHVTLHIITSKDLNDNQKLVL